VPSASKCGGQGGCTGNYRPEVVPSRLSNITLYLQALAVPARRNVNDPDVKRGEQLFFQSRCSACHVPELRTGGKTAIPAAADLPIHAYTDLLLHDMGPDLADICLGQAQPAEFRTEPLMGLRFATAFLHDGRALTIENAIQQHGGEATHARDRFLRLTRGERLAVLAFLRGL
jgi:CxxC motif-containing protein (DUF1111 family)